MNHTNEPWIAIARTGTFTDSEGRPQTFTAADLDAIAAGYDPARHEAPLVFGHPKHSDPAYGWVSGLKRDGEKLFARLARVPGAVRDLVAQGSYRYVSMSLTPDRKTLRHVGLLGAVPPAIDGLGPIALAGESGVTINFATPENQGGTMPTPEELQQQIGALHQQIESLKAENAKLKAQAEEGAKGKEAAEKQAADTAAEFAAFRQKTETTERERRVDALIAEGKLEPAQRAETLSFAAALATASVPVNLSTPDGKTVQITAEEKYFRVLEAAKPDPRFVDFSMAAPLPAHAAGTDQSFNPAELTAKL